MHIDLHTQRDFDPPCECSIAVEPTNDGALWFYIQYCDKHSAAPEMYEALKLAQSWILAHSTIKTSFSEQNAIAQALAKAEGREA